MRVQVTANYNTEQQAVSKGFSSTVFKKDATVWHQWPRFCSWLKITPNLEGIEDPIPFLQIFPVHVRAGLISNQRHTIKKRLVEKFLRSIGKIFASVGSDNPRHICIRKLNFRLGHQLASYQKEYSPPTRVRPLPVNIIQDLYTIDQGTTPRNTAISNFTWVTFFFLIRP